MSLGGLANMCRTFQDIRAQINLGIVPTELGEAEIYIDRKTSSRDSKADLGKHQLGCQIKQSKISHVMYINQLKNLDFIPNLTGIITADTCKGPSVDVSVLKHIDWLFVSDDEVSNLDDIVDNIKGSVIIHSPEGSRIVGQNNLQCYNESLLVENANVLGAGDMFASCFLYAIHNQMTVESAISYAHRTTSRLIGKYNEKI